MRRTVKTYRAARWTLVDARGSIAICEDGEPFLWRTLADAKYATDLADGERFASVVVTITDFHGRPAPKRRKAKGGKRG